MRRQRINRVDNQSRIPTERLRQVVDFVRPNGLQRFVVRYRNSKLCGGNGGGSAALVRVPPRSYRYPIKWTARNGYLGATVYNEQEYLIYLTAHEVRHVQQSKSRYRLRMVWGARTGCYSERDADAYAIQMVRQWRRHGMQPANQRLAIPRRSISVPVLPQPTADERKAGERIAKLGRLAAAHKRWNTKAKRAATALLKIQRQMRRLQRLEKAA